MRKQILTLVAASVAFGAAWLGRDLAPRPGETVPHVPLIHRVPALASVAPLEVRKLATKSEQAADSSGVLLTRRYGPTTTGVRDYYLYLPDGIERGGRWPVILYLHGRSLRGSDLTMLTRYGLPRYLAEGRDLPFIVVAPQLPDGQSWTDTERLASLVEDILARYPADRDRVYLTGYSMGGGGVWRMALAHADLFAAAAPMAALTPAPSDAWSEAFEDLPVRIYHGTADEAAPFAGAAAMAASLRGDGVQVELETYEGARHGDLTRVYGERDLYDWFLEHRR